MENKNIEFNELSKTELIHLVCNKISQMDDEFHYIYNEETNQIEKIGNNGITDWNEI